MKLKLAIARLVHRLAVRLTTQRRQLRGIPVTVINTYPSVPYTFYFERLDEALGLLERYVPHHFRRLRRDFARILIQRRANRGAFLVEERTCLVELSFVANDDITVPEIAAVILHEAMHARLYARGIALEDPAAQERFCRRIESAFGRIVPGGEPVVRRAEESLALANEDIAPVVDPVLAARRVVEVDLRREDIPELAKRRMARRYGIPYPDKPQGAV
jgi:hypothetical protein